MRIIVCIKPVKGEFVYTNKGERESFVINPFDLFALEDCIRLKRETADCTITCLSMGPKAAEDLLIKTMAMGADEAILLNDAAFAGADTVATSHVLSKAITHIGGADLIVFGEKSVDGETGQVVFGVGEQLKYNCMNKINSIEKVENGSLILNRSTAVMTEVMRVNLPFVAAYHDFQLTRPDISLLALKRARRKGVKQLTQQDIAVRKEQCGLDGSRTKVFNIKNEMEKKKKMAVTGDTENKVSLILTLIHDERNRIFH